MITKPIYLIGFMASGKTKTGKRLAKRLEIPFLDLDAVIESEINQSIREFFEANGENAFRELESKCLQQLPLKATVISLGGGTPCFKNNLKYINENGRSIYLRKSPELLIGRLREKKAKRPLVANLSDGELQEYVRKTLKEREEFYLQAHYIFESEKASFNDLVDIALN
jgi:shikimate kinase